MMPLTVYTSFVAASAALVTSAQAGKAARIP